MKPRRQREKGFTLIEVMVALVVFLIGFLGM
ncbi:MAG: prepilin-type N-terminal cleavage/methylation domain-containing protein, partial [Gemmatimonadota bacterium]